MPRPGPRDTGEGYFWNFENLPLLLGRKGGYLAKFQFFTVDLPPPPSIASTSSQAAAMASIDLRRSCADCLLQVCRVYPPYPHPIRVYLRIVSSYMEIERLSICSMSCWILILDLDLDLGFGSGTLSLASSFSCSTSPYSSSDVWVRQQLPMQFATLPSHPVL